MSQPDERTASNGREHRRDSIGIRVRYAVAIIVALIAAYGATKAYTTANSLRIDVQNQVKNRTENVGVWCDELNRMIDYNRAFVTLSTGGRGSYGLADLDCAALERATLASTK